MRLLEKGELTRENLMDNPSLMQKDGDEDEDEDFDDEFDDEEGDEDEDDEEDDGLEVENLKIEKDDGDEEYETLDEDEDEYSDEEETEEEGDAKKVDSNTKTHIKPKGHPNHSLSKNKKHISKK